MVAPKKYKNKGKGSNALSRKAKQLKLQADLSPDKVFVQTHLELLTELQSKFTGLWNLSKKTGHKLLEEIALTFFERLKQVSDAYPEALEIGFKLSSAYRRLYPHFGDFNLILTKLHQLQDAAKAPRTQMVESDLITVPTQPYLIDNVPFDQVEAASAKYSDRIAKKILEHVNSLNTEFNVADSDEELAKKKVREEIKNLAPYLPMIIKEVIGNHFVPRKAPYHRVRIYGEPFMPNKEVVAPALRGLRAVAIMRSNRMFNMLRFSVPLRDYPKFAALDGVNVGGAKLVARSSDMPQYQVSKRLVSEMRASFGVNSDDVEDLDLHGDEQPTFE